MAGIPRVMRLIAPIPRPMRLSFLAVVTVTLALGVWLALAPSGVFWAVAVAEFLRLVGPLVVLALAAHALPAGWWSRRGALRAPLWLALGILTSTAGQDALAWYQATHHHPAPFPWWADLGCLLAYPCLLLGVRTLVRARPGEPGQRHDVFDAAIIMLAIGTISWYLLIGPALLRTDLGLLARIVGAAYPLGDLLLVVGLLALLAYGQDRCWRGACGLLALALGLIVVTDGLDYAWSPFGAYRGGGLLDLGWALSAMLVALGVQVLLLRPAEQRGAGEAASTTSRRWRPMLPYLTLPPILALVIHSRFTAPSPGPLDRGLAAGTMLLLLLVVARQVLAIVEHQRLQETATAAARLLEAANRELASVNARLAVLATTDPVTELPNHRALVAALDRERDRAARYGRQFAILFVDLDHFKAINDSYGHATGDAMLAEVGRVLRAALREVDTVGRWGGEEFLAILPEVTTAGALTAAERVRHAVAEHRFLAGGGLHLTCSIGVSGFRVEAEDTERLVTLADQALYTAKKLGRNQVRADGDPAVTALLDSAEEPRDALALAGTIEALAATVAARDPGRASHAERLAGVALDLGLACGLHPAEARLLSLVARVHDLGTVAISDAILHKPGELTAEEWAVVRTHPAVGADILRHIPALRAVAPLVRAHHEHWDGSGYPDGLAGSEIPLGARVLGVADAFAALTSERAFRHAFDDEEALSIVEREAGIRFDPEVVRHLGLVVAAVTDPAGSHWLWRGARRDGRGGRREVPEEFDWEALVVGD